MPRKYKLAICIAGASAMTIFSASAASAHVSVNPNTAAQGGYTKLTFRVPDEKPAASTTKVEINFPTSDPITSVRVQPLAGWSYVAERANLPTPITSSERSITDVISKITWTADASSAIKPGEFQEFNVSVGPLPKTNSVQFKALQTYSDGDVVRWIDQPSADGTEPEHPAPTLTLTRASSTEDAHGGSTGSHPNTADESETYESSEDGVDSARAFGIAGLVAGIIALLVATGALLIRKKTNA